MHTLMNDVMVGRKSASYPSWTRGVPRGWFCERSVSKEEGRALLNPRATVAQKCTGRAKKPVFLFPTKVIKGPWQLPQDALRLNRELGCSALMKHWALPENPMPVLQPSLFACSENERVYTVTKALYPAPTEEEPWEIEATARSVSAFGPRTLDVIARASTGVVRVSDRLREEPSFILDAPEVWEHLIHRCLLQCGDSGFHNMLVAPDSERAIGIDLDEKRGQSVSPESSDWIELLFKRPPAKRLFTSMEEGIERAQPYLQRVFARLEEVCFDDVTNEIVESHRLERGDWMGVIQQLKGLLLR